MNFESFVYTGTLVKDFKLSPRALFLIRFLISAQSISHT